MTESNQAPVFEPLPVRRRNQERQGQPAIYEYDSFPQPFLVQVVQILERAIGSYLATGVGYVVRRSGGYSPEKTWGLINEQVSHEIGEFDLSPNLHRERDKFSSFLTASSRSRDEILLTIEFAFRTIIPLERMSKFDQYEFGVLLSPDEAIEHLNHRLRRHDLGYQFVAGQLIRVDEQFVHAEVVEPAIAALHSAGFEGALNEFLKGHKEYRLGNYKTAMNEAQKAVESTMKAICTTRGWTHPSNPNASQLIKVLLDQGLVPKENESLFNGIRTILESGTPTMRNRMSAHGQGQSVVNLPDYIAAFGLHLAASTIVLLMEAHQALSSTSSVMAPV
jgi:hypothetical protein